MTMPLEHHQDTSMSSSDIPSNSLDESLLKEHALIDSRYLCSLMVCLYRSSDNRRRSNVAALVSETSTQLSQVM